MKIAKSLFLLVLLVTFTGCAEISQEAEAEQEPKSAVYTLEEIASHNSHDDCWLAINEKIYNVTSFVGSHPGGEAILEGCGKDATEFFETRPMGSGTPHSEKARENLENFYIGDLK